ncbi:MAG: transposase [Candidatus Deferrimicrobiota bacterium]
MRSVRSLFLMECARLGSLNALEQARPNDPSKGWLGGPPPSADALGDAAAALSLDDLREGLFAQYTVLKRNKAIRPLPRGFLVLILDAHESGASYLRCSEGSLTRTIKTSKGERLQFYYRHVAAMLLHAGGEVLLDVEALRPGEDEIAAATRLFERVVARYPRAFDTVSGDALYLNPAFCRLARRHGKYFIAVLKNENRDLVVDARSLFPLTEPHRWTEGHTDIEAWDIPDLTTWTQYGKPVRVVRTLETHPVRRQRTKEVMPEKAEWMWGTNIPLWKAPRDVIVRLGHGRWSIENQGFNEIVHAWHGDHIYKNHPNAIAACYLLLFLAYNLFHAFFTRDLKPALRAAYTMAFLVEKIRAAFYEAVPLHARGRPP